MPPSLTPAGQTRHFPLNVLAQMLVVWAAAVLMFACPSQADVPDVPSDVVSDTDSPEVELPDCSSMAMPRRFDVFVVADSLTKGNFEIPDRSLKGEVLQVGDGAPPGCVSDEHCVPLTAYIATAEEPQGVPAGGYWFRLTDESDGSEWTVSVSIPGHTRPLSVGDDVTVELGRKPGHYSPHQTHFRLNVGETPVVFVEEGGWLPDIELTDIAQVSVGTAVCSSAENCGEWRRHDIDVKTIAGETSGVLKYGGELTVGDWRLLHAGLVTETSVSCTDTHYASVVLAAVRTP